MLAPDVNFFLNSRKRGLPCWRSLSFFPSFFLTDGPPQVVSLCRKYAHLQNLLMCLLSSIRSATHFRFSYTNCLLSMSRKAVALFD